MNLSFGWKRFKYNIRNKYRKIRAQIGYYVFDFDSRVYEVTLTIDPYLKGFSVLLALLALVSVIIPTGFELTGSMQHLNRLLEVSVLAGFTLQYYIRLVLTPHRIEFVKFRWLETLATAVATVFLAQLLFDYMLGSDQLIHFIGLTISFQTAILIVQGYLIFFIVVKSLQALPRFLARYRNTSQLLLISFAAIILLGSILLMLPKATLDGQGLSPVNALFTSTSAICVTGLIVVDTATHFTLFGELVILGLIQIGGLGIITFATFLALLISDEFSVGQKNVLRDVVQEKDVSLITTTLKRVVGLTLGLELLGAAGYYFSWSPALFEDGGQRMLFSIFHAVSAFCNAGFSLFSDSLAGPRVATDGAVNIITMMLIILGGLGFPTLWELYHRYRGKQLRISIQSRIILIMTSVLIVSGAGLFYLLEADHTLAGESASTGILYSLFQSITTRTAGFNTIDIGSLSASTTIIFMILMAIGASPASTAGGLKTTTIYMLFSSAWNTMRGRDRLEIGHRTIPKSVLRRAITSLTLAFICLSISTVLLTVVEDAPFIDLLFEEISAFATVGLSRGITFDLSAWGKLIIIISMFVGRVGSLTLAASFVTKRDNRKYQYPEESLMVS